MLFNSVDFLVFFPIVTMVYFLLPHKVRWVWLLVTSYYFYMCWNAKYALLMATSTAITWLSGLLIAKAGEIQDETKQARRKKLWVALSFLLNLAILFFFKYFNFFLNNLNALAGLIGVEVQVPAFDVILPVGISFYTFQALSYTMDVYRGEIPPERNIFRYALFVSFFPQLVAGPIERSKNLLGQLYEYHTFDPQRVRDGLMLMLWGMFEKVVIADRVSMLVTYVYDNYTTLPGGAVILATVLFAVQIYCDFGGYSDIAIGAAQVLGFRLMENFHRPYLSRSAGEFWHRWHISLSTWFRDYLYIPLGGNRKGTARKYLNVMITFLTSGLWHGASWNFVVWGGLNGGYQVAGALLKPWRERVCSRLHINRETFAWRCVQTVFTFCLIDFAWLFFRASSFSAALGMIAHTVTHMTAFGTDMLFTWGLEKPDFLVALAAIAVLILADVLREKYGSLRENIGRQRLPVRWLIYFAGVFAIVIFGIYGPGYAESQFIYFQF